MHPAVLPFIEVSWASSQGGSLIQHVILAHTACHPPAAGAAPLELDHQLAAQLLRVCSPVAVEGREGALAQHVPPSPD